MLAGDDRAHPTACASRWQLTFDDPIPADELHARIALLLSDLATGLRKGGSNLIGHIKGLIDAGEDGHLRFSMTSFEEGARFKGVMSDGIREAFLTTNVIVYGIEAELVEAVLEEAFSGHFHGRRSCADGGGGDAR
jgi:hypothetical protein